MSFTPRGDRPDLDMRQAVSVLWRRKWWILLVTTLAVAAAVLYSFEQRPVYEARVRIIVSPANLATSDSAETINLETERGLASSTPTAREAASRLDTDLRPGALLAGLTVEIVPGTEFLDFFYVAPTPSTARARAQAFASAYLEVRRTQILEDTLAAAETVQAEIDQLSQELVSIQQQLAATSDPFRRSTLEVRADALSGQVALLGEQAASLAAPQSLRLGEIVEPALATPAPINQNRTRNVLLALAAGLGIGIAVALLRERLDDRLLSVGNVEDRLQAPVLAAVPRIRKWRRRAKPVFVAMSHSISPQMEAYRHLRTGLLVAASQRAFRTVMITSALPGEGKTSTAANLGVMLARSGKRVTLLSADLRWPRLGDFFDISNDPGLVNVLAGEVSVSSVKRPTTEKNLSIVPAGELPANPTELLASDAMRDVLRQLEEQADLVLVDTAPLLAAADGLTLAPIAKNVVLVVDVSNTGGGMLDEVRHSLRHVDAHLVGAVANNFRSRRFRVHATEYDNGHTQQRSGPEVVVAPEAARWTRSD